MGIADASAVGPASAKGEQFGATLGAGFLLVGLATGGFFLIRSMTLGTSFRGKPVFIACTTLVIIVAAAAIAGLLRGKRWARFLSVGLAGAVGIAVVVHAGQLHAMGIEFTVAAYAMAALGVVAWLVLLDRAAGALQASLGALLVAIWMSALAWVMVGVGG